MTHDLTIDSGETYRVDSGTTETHARTTIRGTLDVDGTLVLSGEEPSGTTIDDDLTLPRELDLANLNMGIAVFLIGVMGLQLAATYALRNWAAGIMWSMSFIILIFAGVFGLGLELFWMAVVATTILLVAGMGIKWGRL